MTELIKPCFKTNQMIAKFKQRQSQKTVQQALVYLKLKDFNCPTRSALIFSNKKQKNIDGTIKKDGPANYRKLTPVKSDGIMVNGWLRGHKLKYQNTTSFNDCIKNSASSLLAQISSINKESRKIEDNQRKNRSKTLLNINQNKPKDSIQTITAIKDNVMKQREINPFVFKIKGLELPQMTKIFSQQITKMDINGLVVKAGVFQNCINDSQVQFVANDENPIAKSTKNVRDTAQMTMLDKRNQVLNYKQRLNEININEINRQPNHIKQSQNLKKFTKTFNLSRSASRDENNLRFPRSKSAKNKIEQQQFDNKVIQIIKKDYFPKKIDILREFKPHQQKNILKL